MNDDAPTPLKYCVARRTPKVKRHNRDEWPIRTDYDLACALVEFASPAAFAATHPTELGDALARALFTRDLALAELRWCDAERRLALRALGDMRECIRWHDEVRAVVDKATRWGAAVMRAQAAQIAAADEEWER